MSPISILTLIAASAANATPYHSMLDGWASMRLQQLELGIDCQALDGRTDAASIGGPWSVRVVDPVYLCIGTMVPRGEVPETCALDGLGRGDHREEQGCAGEAAALLGVYEDLRGSISSDLEMARQRGDRTRVTQLEEAAHLLYYDERIGVRLRSGDVNPSAVSIEFLQTPNTADKLWMAALGEALLRGSARGVLAPTLKSPPPPVRITLTYEQAPDCVPALSLAEPASPRSGLAELSEAVETVLGTCSAEGPLRVTLGPLELRSGAVVWLPGDTILEVL